MFEVSPNGEVSQVELWNLYKDAFQPYPLPVAMLQPQDFIRNVQICFPTTQPMVAQPSNKFVVRGLQRIQEAKNDRFQCLWDRSKCDHVPFASAHELYEHLLEHVASAEGSDTSCLLATCSQGPAPKQQLRAHLLTHLPPSSPPEMPESQSTSITLSVDSKTHPLPNPTARAPPPPPNASIVCKVPRGELPPSALTALLCIRVLFKTAFAEAEEAPKADEDHFGFPGVQPEEEVELVEVSSETLVKDQEGRTRGKKAFMRLRHLMEEIRIHDEALMSWITQMVVACSLA